MYIHRFFLFSNWVIQDQLRLLYKCSHQLILNRVLKFYCTFSVYPEKISDPSVDQVWIVLSYHSPTCHTIQATTQYIQLQSTIQFLHQPNPSNMTGIFLRCTFKIVLLLVPINRTVSFWMVLIAKLLAVRLSKFRTDCDNTGICPSI